MDKRDGAALNYGDSVDACALCTGEILVTGYSQLRNTEKSSGGGVGGRRGFNVFYQKRDGQTEGRSDGRMDGRTNKWADELTDGQMDGRTDGRMEGRTDGRTNGRIYPLIEVKGRINKNLINISWLSSDSENECLLNMSCKYRIDEWSQS